MSLTPKQSDFADEYLIDLNATQAALRAKYSANTAAKIGWENLQKPEIQAAIAERIAARSKRTEITADRVLIEVARLAFLDIRKAFDSNGNLKAIHDLDDDTAAAIAGIEISEDIGENGAVTKLKKIKLSDKRSSLELAGRHLQMWTDKISVSGEISIAAAIRARVAAREK